MIELPRSPDETKKGGSEVSLTITYRDSAGTLFTPTTAPTCSRTADDGTTVAVTMTNTGTGTYTISDALPKLTTQKLYLYEWSGVDSGKPDIYGDWVVKATPTYGV